MRFGWLGERSATAPCPLVQASDPVSGNLWPKGAWIDHRVVAWLWLDPDHWLAPYHWLHFNRVGPAKRGSQPTRTNDVSWRVKTNQRAKGPVESALVVWLIPPAKQPWEWMGLHPPTSMGQSPPAANRGGLHQRATHLLVEVSPASSGRNGKQVVDRLTELAALAHATPLLAQLPTQEQLHRRGAGNAGLLSDVGFRLDVDLHGLGLTGKVLQHPFELGLQHMAGAAAG